MLLITLVICTTKEKGVRSAFAFYVYSMELNFIMP